MKFGLLGKKLGMTQVFTEDGKRVSVTALEVGPCPVLAVTEKSLQLGFEEVPEKKVKKPQLGYFKKLKISPRVLIREVTRDPDTEYTVGDELKVNVFNAGEYVDVTGVSLGKGFQGGMKRWNWSGGPASHGSMSHRRIGSIGASATPSRVWKGQHLPGHMGHQKVTVQNLKVVRADDKKNVLLVRGAVPGHKNSYVIVRRAVKKKTPVKK
ncbi:MAG: 50S ribosomal protein L3 [Candidatus Omnitrophica bacterium]|nr:50S ribosomal protein L3 [Candidatus Omnitrophota bacterium]